MQSNTYKRLHFSTRGRRCDGAFAMACQWRRQRKRREEITALLLDPANALTFANRKTGRADAEWTTSKACALVKREVAEAEKRRDEAVRAMHAPRGRFGGPTGGRRY